ncbi:SDR family NAD(P)-dependent oxidoreductase [Pseudarthrobacter sp. YAF2]|uniref:SDR family NAD(P)-dependent oxidoreductase n=1 Tax=Pseudarthrobacter sp. YAF2 TaxID=3233078 RepID=UPI003F946BC6
MTGAAGGLGKAIADGLADCGATVYGTSRDSVSAGRVSDRYGTPCLPVDLADTGSIGAFVSSLWSASGGIDLLVNNAGVNVPKPALDLTDADWDSVFDTNLRGSFFLSTEVARHWTGSGSQGSIVNIASQAGIVGIEERAAYGASKAGLIHLTRILALEWASAGIRVNAVAPTFVRTELTASTLGRQDWADELLSRIPAGRFGEPEDVAGAVAFLLTGAASMITGHTLVVDGGYTIR